MSAPASSVTCPECGTVTGPGTQTDTYRHAVMCFHLEDKGPAYFLSDWTSENPEYKRRVVIMMKAAASDLKAKLAGLA